MRGVFILFCLLTLNGMAQTNLVIPETVLIRVFEPVSNVSADESDAKIITITPDGEVISHALELVKIGKSGSIEVFARNQQKIKTEITKWNNAGFTVKGLSHVSIGIFTITTILLEKSS